MNAPYQSEQYAGFIDRIRQAPNDDVIRRVASDWLRDQGQEDRASFIECQLEIAELEKASGGKLPMRSVKCREIRADQRPSLPNTMEGIYGRGYYHQPTRIEFRATTECVERFEIGEVVQLDCNAQFNRFSAICMIAEVRPDLPHACMFLIAVPTDIPENFDRWRELKGEEERLWRGNATPACYADMWCLSVGIDLIHDVKPLVGGPTSHSRGFLESIRIRGADWITHAEQILRLNPVRKVCIVGDVNYGHLQKIILWMDLQCDELGPKWIPRPNIDRVRKERPPFGEGPASWADQHQRHIEAVFADRWPGIEFTFEREGHTLEQAHEAAVRMMGERWGVPAHLLGDASNQNYASASSAIPPGLYFGNESITVDEANPRPIVGESFTVELPFD